MTAADTTRVIEAIWRIEAATLVASLARLVRDVARAEDLAQDALVSALDQWPKQGIPDRPGAWLMAVARRRAVDSVRREKLTARKHSELAYSIETLREEHDPAATLDDDIGDDLLSLIFTACHPLLAEESRVALTLRLIGGLTTEEIARAFLVSEATVAQRIVRAKRRLSEAGIPFELPRGEERVQRLSSVLAVLYAIFNEGYSATTGEDWLRPQLCEEAMRLGRILAQLVPADSETQGLLALMELQASRLNARSGPLGEPVLLLDQDRSRWDLLLIRRGLAALRRAATIDGARGPYALQAAIAACHALAPTAAETDWRLIAALYGALAQVMPSPVVELNRAVALGKAFGPATGLELADALRHEGALAGYHLLAAVRGDLLEQLDRCEEARAEFERAARLTRNARERALLLGRANAIGPRPPAR
jgi:RNA polymerase sigma factor (sigma-70 family)